MRVPVLILAAVVFGASPGAGADNEIVLGPGFVKSQSSAHPLVYRLPDGWREDGEAARRNGIAAVLVPAGKTLGRTAAAITIAFQRKNASKPELATLKGFFTTDMQSTLGQFPDTEPARWQPRGLNPDVVQFMSIELRPAGPKASAFAAVG